MDWMHPCSVSSMWVRRQQSRIVSAQHTLARGQYEVLIGGVHHRGTTQLPSLWRYKVQQQRSPPQQQQPSKVCHRADLEISSTWLRLVTESIIMSWKYSKTFLIRNRVCGAKSFCIRGFPYIAITRVGTATNYGCLNKHCACVRACVRVLVCVHGGQGSFCWRAHAKKLVNRLTWNLWGLCNLL